MQHITILLVGLLMRQLINIPIMKVSSLIIFTLEEALPFVDLKDAAPVKMLDTILVVGQKGEVARRGHMAFLTRIEMIVSKPRTFYTIGEMRSQDMMCSPAFTLDNKVVGIGTLRTTKGQSAQGYGNFLVVIVPPEDILESAQQVPAAETSE